jgi:glucose/arabinose dehydrogenase
MVAADGIISTVAGTGEEGVSGDGGPAVDARLRSPDHIAVGPDGELYTVDSPGRRAGSTVVVDGARVRKVGADREISTVAGGGGCAEEGEQYDVARASFCDGVRDIAVAADGAVYVPDPRTDAVWMLSPEGTMIRLPVYLSAIFSLTISAADDLYVGRGLGQGEPHVVQRVPLSVPAAPVPTADAGPPWNDLPARTLALVAGTGQPGFAGDGGPAMAAQLSGPGSLAAGPDGTIYMVDTLNRRVRSIRIDGTIETYAGDGEVGDQPPKQHAGPAPGDGGLAVDASLHIPVGVAVGPDGSVYICDEPDQRVYRVSPAGVITTFAGTGEEAFSGDGGLAIDAALARPVDVAVGPDGSLYVADHGNHRIRKVDPNGIITTVAGTGDVDVHGLDGGFSGDGGPAIDANLSEPRAVAVGPDGTVYVVANLRIREIDPFGTITSLTRHPDDVMDEPDDLGGRVPVQELAISPTDLSAATDGTLYVAAGARVLAIGTDGGATVVAGTGDVGDRAGEEETAQDAHLPVVNAIALDPAGNLYLSHTEANQVQAVVRVTEQPDELPWHWLVLGLVVAVALVAIAVSFRHTRRAGSAPGSATSES